MYRITIQSFDTTEPTVFEGGQNHVISELATFFKTSRTTFKPRTILSTKQLEAKRRTVEASRLWRGTPLTVRQISLLCKTTPYTIRNYMAQDRSQNGGKLFPHRRPSAIKAGKHMAAEVAKRKQS